MLLQTITVVIQEILFQFFGAPPVKKLFQNVNEIFLTLLKSVASCHALCDTSYVLENYFHLSH